ncbi:U-box domain-containing protein 45-like [Bidens hawaiensis]|uniref:U-box domain-containing protein 45-like n=1 Tax=Bidens hawaiensis TaxID=980011 RepID=UPI004048EC3F
MIGKSTGEEECSRNQRKQTLIDEISDRLINGDMVAKIQAAREIRSMIRNRNSAGKIRVKFAGAGVIQPLVLMLCSQHHDAREVSLLALLNLAYRNDRNKEQIVTCGAIPPLLKLLKFQTTGNLRELATAAILTLSASPNNKQAIASSGAVLLLIQVLSCGMIQGRVDAVTALHNLTATEEEPAIDLDSAAALPLINLLKECKMYSKFADKVTGLIRILSKSDEGRLAITNAEDGILTLVETVEDGSLVSTEHAVSVLLEMCKSSRSKYRELILNEGAIPGLLRLTVDGIHEARDKARLLLDLLRESTAEKRMSSSVVEKMVHEIAAQVDGSTVETAQILLQDMVQRSMKMR